MKVTGSFLDIDATFEREGWGCRFTCQVQQGEWVSIIGPSGGGKSTFLELLAGFIKPNQGCIRKNGKNLCDFLPSQRGITMVFQKNTLFFHLTLRENLLLAMHDLDLSLKDKEKKIHAVLEELYLSSRYLCRFPNEVSGGELARFNLARALLRPADILLLDEAFSALDESLRFDLHTLVYQLHKHHGMTTLSVTHHQEDAFVFAERVFIVMNGKFVATSTLGELLAQKELPDNLCNFLRFGTVWREDSTGVQWFLRPQDIMFTPESIPLEQRGVVTLGEFLLASDGWMTRVVDLKNRRVFLSLQPQKNFSGVLFFDKSQALRVRSGS